MEDPKSSGPDPDKPAPALRPRNARPGMNADKLAFLARIKAIADDAKAERDKN